MNEPISNVQYVYCCLRFDGIKFILGFQILATFYALPILAGQFFRSYRERRQRHHICTFGLKTDENLYVIS
jgi:hypothetical protein